MSHLWTEFLVIDYLKECRQRT